MDNKTYRNIQKLILLFGLTTFIVINIQAVSTFVLNIFSFFTPFITGICIAFIVNIPMIRIEKSINKFFGRKSRGLSIFLAIIVFVLVIGLIFSMIIPEIISSIGEIRNGLPKVIDSFDNILKNKDNQILKTLYGLGVDFDKIYNNIASFFKNFSIVDGTNALQSIFTVTSNLFSTVMNIFLGLIFAVYILSQKEILITQGHGLISAIFSPKQTKSIENFLGIVSNSFAKFIAGQGTEAVILCFLFLASMTALRIPKAVPVATIIGLFSLIPLVGSFLAASYGALTILIVSPIKSVWFIILFLVLQQIEGNLIYPRVVGKSVGLPGIWVLLAITVGGNFAGITGMIMAVPTMSIIYTLISSFVRSRNAKADNGLKDEENPSVNANYDDVIVNDKSFANADGLLENLKQNIQKKSSIGKKNKKLQPRKTKTNKK